MVKPKDEEIISFLMKKPRATDEQLAEATGLSRSGAAKRRKQLEQKKELIYFAGPNLEKIEYRVYAGGIELSPHVSFKEAEAAAKRLSSKEEMVSVWIYEMEGWYINYLAVIPHLENRKEIKKWGEALKLDFREWFGGNVKRSWYSSPTYVLKMLGKEFEGKWFD